MFKQYIKFSLRGKDIGEKYRALDKNQFRNEYLRGLVELQPQYKKYLRVLLNDFGYAYRDPEYKDMNKMYRKEIAYRTFYELVKKRPQLPNDQ